MEIKSDKGINELLIFVKTTLLLEEQKYENYNNTFVLLLCDKYLKLFEINAKKALCLKTNFDIMFRPTEIINELVVTYPEYGTAISEACFVFGNVIGKVYKSIFEYINNIKKSKDLYLSIISALMGNNELLRNKIKLAEPYFIKVINESDFLLNIDVLEDLTAKFKVNKEELDSITSMLENIRFSELEEINW